MIRLFLLRAFDRNSPGLLRLDHRIVGRARSLRVLSFGCRDKVGRMEGQAPGYERDDHGRHHEPPG
ncbi:hypothetical protein COMA2_80125 [Candidatus Nitrospira nitrificans]|uniref:Uncharacterized protein n=1 Tax=Candidatus Nitrospira nitrificans TaxID=1742973 RepID=A0A0S4LRU4_9BACT|nr:hypothetical protein COMA2_80125 [Candidatus Nitrospira nitrificans]